MKKKIFALSLSVIMAFSLAACGKSAENNETTTTASDIAEKGEINLGEYKGLTVYSDDIQVKDSDLEAYISQRLESDATTEYKTTGVVKKNDKVKLSFKGTIDGKEFSGGTTEGTVVTMSDGGFTVDGFVDAIIGHSIGEKLELDLTMPKDYSDESLKGKAVHFSVSLDSLVVTVTPELTDDYVKSEYSGLGLNTVGEFTEYLKNDLLINNIYTQIWSKILENSKVVTYEKARYDEYYKIVSENNVSQIQSTYGMTLEQYLQKSSMSQADWDEKLSAYVKAYLKEEMVIEKIAEVENISITDDQFDTKMLEYAKLYGYDNVEDFKKAYENVEDDEFRFSVLAYYVQEFVAKQAKVVAGSNPDKATTAEATTPANEETTATEETTSAN